MFLMFCFCSPQVSSFSWKDEELRHKKYKLREFRGTEISEYPFDGKVDKCVHKTYKNMKMLIEGHNMQRYHAKLCRAFKRF